MISEKLSAVTSSDIVVGEPVKFGAINVVPIAKISISIGASGGEGNSFSDKRSKHWPEKGTGGGSGGSSVMVKPVAVVVFYEQGVEILPIPDKKSRLDKLLDKVPEIIDMVKKAKGETAT